MRKVTNEVVNAFVNGSNFKQSNTRVETRDGETFMYLHNNMIAHKGEGFLFLTTCGWESNTTKERLNGILRAFNLDQISQRNWIWYRDGKEFNGCQKISL